MRIVVYEHLDSTIFCGFQHKKAFLKKKVFLNFVV